MSEESLSSPPAPVRKRAVRPGAQAAMDVLQRLYGCYPKMFGARFLPLKIGVFQDIMARHPGDFAKEELKAALGTHARSTRYLESIAAGHPRHDLDGKPVEPVAPEHVHHAVMEVYKRRAGRNPEAARAWRRERLAAAVLASGLAREAYEQTVHATDADALEAIDEAFAEVASRAARREALRRAFAASGADADGFAEMYGLAPDEVRALLDPPVP